MTKFSIQFSILILAFGSLWFGFSQVDWMHLFRIKENTSKLEGELGNFYMKSLKMLGEEIDEGEVFDTLEDIKDKLCSANGIDPDEVKLHLVRTSEVNAFAAPDKNLVVLTGLLDYCNSFEEVAGVMAHEIGHIQENHVMKKLAKEIGLSVLISASTSGSIGPETIKMLTSTAYDRTMEKEADRLAVKYMIKTGIDPKPFADMMFRLSLEESTFTKNLTFISTHPNTDERVENILKHVGKESAEYEPLFPEQEWSQFKEKVGQKE